MADFGIAEFSALASALAATAGAGTALYGASQGGKSAGLPTPPKVDTTALSKSLLPGAKADAAARTGGGLSPDFLSNLVDQQSGTPGAGLDIMADIRKSLNQGP